MDLVARFCEQAVAILTETVCAGTALVLFIADDDCARPG